MGFITINYSLNQTYIVEKAVFEKIVKKADKNTKLSKINSFEVFILDEKNDFKVDVNIDVKKGATYKEALLELQTEIENYSLNVIDSKPENITIFIEGEYK